MHIHDLEVGFREEKKKRNGEIHSCLASQTLPKVGNRFGFQMNITPQDKF